MIRLSVIIITLGFLITPLHSFSQDRKKGGTILATNPATSVSFDKTTHKFGSIDHGVPATATFTLKNNSPKPIEILSVTINCECATFNYPTQPIKPQSKGKVTVTFDSNSSGYFKKTIKVNTKDGKAYPVFIQGTVKSEPVKEIK